MLAGTLEKRIGEKSGRQSLPEAWKWQKRYFVLSEPQGKQLRRMRPTLRLSPSQPAACAATIASAPFPSQELVLCFACMAWLESWPFGMGATTGVSASPLSP